MRRTVRGAGEFKMRVCCGAVCTEKGTAPNWSRKLPHTLSFPPPLQRRFPELQRSNDGRRAARFENTPGQLRRVDHEHTLTRPSPTKPHASRRPRRAQNGHRRSTPCCTQTHPRSCQRQGLPRTAFTRRSMVVPTAEVSRGRQLRHVTRAPELPFSPQAVLRSPASSQKCCGCCLAACNAQE
jgi:hypothetical protein